MAIRAVTTTVIFDFKLSHSSDDISERESFQILL